MFPLGGGGEFRKIEDRVNQLFYQEAIDDHIVSDWLKSGDIEVKAEVSEGLSKIRYRKFFANYSIRSHFFCEL